MLTVYVVMSNDYPDSVFSTEKLAKDYVAAKELAAREPRNYQDRTFVYWKVYPFNVDGKL